MAKCPLCNSKIDVGIFHSTPLHELSRREIMLYKAVASSNEDGIDSAKLTQTMYPNGSKLPPSAYGMMRTAICGLNHKLKKHKQRIKGTRTVGYRLLCDGP